MSILMLEDDVLQPGLYPLPQLSSLPLNPLSKVFDIPESVEYWQARRLTSGSPIEFSDSDSCSDSDDDTLSIVSASSNNRKYPILRDVSPIDYSDVEIPAYMEGNALGLIFEPQAFPFDSRAVATPNPQAGSLQAPHYHQDVRDRDRPSQDCQSYQKYAAPNSYVPANDTLVGGRPQDTYPQGDVSEASSLERFQELSVSYAPENWLRVGEPGQEEEVDYDAGGETYDLDVQYAPIMRPIALPDEEETSESLFYSGPDLGGWLAGTVDGVSKTITLCPSPLNVPLPLPFLAEDELGLTSAEFGEQEYGHL